MTENINDVEQIKQTNSILLRLGELELRVKGIEEAIGIETIEEDEPIDYEAEDEAYQKEMKERREKEILNMFRLFVDLISEDKELRDLMQEKINRINAGEEVDRTND